MVEKGGYVVMIDVDNINGGLKLNTEFFVDFGAEPNGPMLPHEIRYETNSFLSITLIGIL